MIAQLRDMDRNTLSDVIMGLYDLKESIFLLEEKIEKSKKLNDTEKEYFKKKIERMYEKIEQIERRLYTVTTKESKEYMDIDRIVDRIVLTVHDLVDLLYTEINVDMLWDIHDESLRLEKDLEEKGIQ